MCTCPIDGEGDYERKIINLSKNIESSIKCAVRVFASVDGEQGSGSSSLLVSYSTAVHELSIAFAIAMRTLQQQTTTVASGIDEESISTVADGGLDTAVALRERVSRDSLLLLKVSPLKQLREVLDLTGDHGVWHQRSA